MTNEQVEKLLTEHNKKLHLLLQRIEALENQGKDLETEEVQEILEELGEMPKDKRKKLGYMT